jgi:hypothetical protein
VLIPTGIVVAASMWALGFACGPFSGSCTAINIIAWPVVGVTMLVTGSVLLGLYNRSHPLDATRPEILDARRERRPPVRFEGMGLAFMPGGAAAGLTFTF